MNTFSIDVSQDVLNDLHARIAQTRLPDKVRNAGWDYDRPSVITSIGSNAGKREMGHTGKSSPRARKRLLMDSTTPRRRKNRICWWKISGLSFALTGAHDWRKQIV